MQHLIPHPINPDVHTFRIKNFASFFQSATKKRCVGFNAFFTKQPGKGQFDLQVAFIASKKYVGKRANKRQRVKRRLRAALVSAITSAPPCQGPLVCVQLAFMAQKQVLIMPWPQLTKELSLVWKMVCAASVKPIEAV